MRSFLQIDSIAVMVGALKRLQTGNRRSLHPTLADLPPHLRPRLSRKSVIFKK